MDWVAEQLYPGWAQSFQVRAEVVRERSAFQDIRVVETAQHGRVLLLDGIVQITEADDFVYQEMISHVPVIEHGNARRVLIVGAGDGGVLRHVLQHRDVERATMVEIDEAVVRLSKQYLPKVGGSAWDDPRASVMIGDGIAYVRQAPADSFDVIIVDSTDPVGPGEGLFTAEFYRDCRRLLGSSGILVNQSGVPFMQPEELAHGVRDRAAAFGSATAYVAAVPTYVGGFMTIGFACAGGSARISADEARSRAEASGISALPRYWTPDVHHAAFALPRYIADLLQTT